MNKPIEQEARELIDGARRSEYGPVEDSFKYHCMAVNSILGPKLKAPVEPHEFALIMASYKLTREANKHKRDNLVDAIGYILLAQKLNEFDQKP